MKVTVKENEKIEVLLESRIDGENAGEIQKELLQIASEYPGKTMELNAAECRYLSSAGLRALLFVIKKHPVKRIYNVSEEVYGIFEVTGFTGIVTIEQADKNIEGSAYECLGSDFYGINYRKDAESLIRIYSAFITKASLQKGEYLSKLALKEGISAALFLEQAKIDEQYASLYAAEKDSIALSSARQMHPERAAEYDYSLSNLLRKLHAKMAAEEELELLSDRYCDLLHRLHLPEEDTEKLCRILQSLPLSNLRILRDLNEGYIIVEQGQILQFTDLSGMAIGSPLLELASYYIDLEDRLAEQDPDVPKEAFLHFLSSYVLLSDEKDLQPYYEVTRMAALILRLVRCALAGKEPEDSLLDQVHKEVLKDDEDVRTVIRKLKELISISAERSVPYCADAEQMYLSVDTNGKAPLLSVERPAFTCLTIHREKFGGEICVEAEQAVEKNGKYYEAGEEITAEEGDIFHVDQVWFSFGNKELIYPYRKNLSDRLTIEIRERTAKKMFKTKTLLKDINLALYPGEMVLLIGSSGAGKTTFMNAVTGYEKADATIRKSGIDIYREYERIKHQIGFAPQQDLLRGEDSVYNTLKNAAEMRLPSDISHEDMLKRVDEVLDIFGLPDLKHERVTALSGGQRKRLSIAVEFIADPILFFLDEPDSGLDGVMARSLMEDLRKITGDDKIVVIISHSPDRVIELFDKVIVLTKSEEDGAGHLAFFGSIPEARDFFKRDTMEEILKLVNRTAEGGEGKGQTFINKFRERY